MNVEFLQSQFVCLLHFIEESVDHALRASMLPKPQNRRVGRRAPVSSEVFPRRAPTRPQPPWFSASRARAAPAAVIFRARRFAASQSARAPRHQTRAGQFGSFPASRTHASTAAVVFRVTRPRGTSRRDLPRPALRRVPIRESAVSPDARRLVRRVYPRHAPARRRASAASAAAICACCLL